MDILRRLIDYLKEAKEEIQETEDDFLKQLKNRDFKFQQDGACEFFFEFIEWSILSGLCLFNNEVMFAENVLPIEQSTVKILQESLLIILRIKILCFINLASHWACKCIEFLIDEIGDENLISKRPKKFLTDDAFLWSPYSLG